MNGASSSPVADHHWSRYAPGTTAFDVRPADLVLIARATTGLHHAVGFGQALRPALQPYAGWNHVAITLDESGGLAQAVKAGVIPGHLDDYRDFEYCVVRFECSDEDRAQAVHFAHRVMEAPERTEYGWLTFCSLGLTLLTGSRVVFGQIGTTICSGFAAEALVRLGEVFERPPAYMLPADLARAYNVPSPSGAVGPLLARSARKFAQRTRQRTLP